MSPLDLLDRITAGHLTYPSPERESSRSPPRRPSTLHRAVTALVHWLRLVYMDLLTMVFVLFAVWIIMVFWSDVFRWNERFFPMTWDPVSERWYGPPELSYPQSPFVLAVPFLAGVIPGVGATVVVGMQVWVRSFWDVNAGLFGLFKGLIMMTFIQTFLKQWIGEFRPHFITACKPVLSPPNMEDPFPFRRFVTPDNCLPKPDDAFHVDLFTMQSFPSGHTLESFFVGTFLALYLNAKLKAFSDYHTSLWKWFAVMLPLLGSCVIAGTLVVDKNHHVHDILLSTPIGVLVAFLAYRSHYASIFDYRTNHLPLPWSGTDQSLHPTIPAPETEPGDNLAAVRWPRKPVEHSFDGLPEQATVYGVDGTADRPRGLRRISRGRLRQNIFAQPTPLMQDQVGAIAEDDQGDFEPRDAPDTDGARSPRNISRGRQRLDASPEPPPLAQDHTLQNGDADFEPGDAADTDGARTPRNISRDRQRLDVAPEPAPLVQDPTEANLPNANGETDQGEQAEAADPPTVTGPINILVVALMRNTSGAVVPNAWGGHGIRDVVNLEAVDYDNAGNPVQSTARATGRQVVLERQREERRTTYESGEEA